MIETWGAFPSYEAVRDHEGGQWECRTSARAKSRVVNLRIFVGGIVKRMPGRTRQHVGDPSKADLRAQWRRVNTNAAKGVITP